MMKMSQIVLFIALSLYGISESAWAEQQGYSKRSEQLLQGLKEQIKSTLADVSSAEQKAGHDPHDFSYQMTIPAKKQYRLGLVVDARHMRDGLKVVSVEPGSTADRAGIKNNDRILAVDGINIAKNIRNVAQLGFLLHPRVDDQLLLQLDSAGKHKTITLKVPSVYVPKINLNVKGESSSEPGAKEGCGFVQVGKRSLDNHISAAVIRYINGIKAERIRKIIKLPAGKNIITVAQGAIGSTAVIKGGDKSIEVDVQPNMKYYVGAGVFSTRGVWIPIMYQTKAAECSSN